MLFRSEASDHTATMTAISAINAIDPTVLQTDLQAALTALGWTPPPTADENATATATAVVSLFAAKLGGTP